MPVEQRSSRVATLVLLTVIALAGCDATPQSAAGAVEPDVATSTSVNASPVAAPLAAPPSALGSRPVASPARTRAKSATSPAVADNPASRLRTLPAATRQVVVVHGAGYATTTATLEAFTESNGQWQPAFPAMAAHIGGNGFSDSKQEGDRTTPTGMYAFDGTMYGVADNPGTKFSYHQLVVDDWWNENGDTPGYNTFSHGPAPGGPSEALWKVTPQYTHFAVVRYNMPATAGRGSGIFLHQSNGNATLGCISVEHDDLVRLLRWLDPAQAPRIVLSPNERLGRY